MQDEFERRVILLAKVVFSVVFLVFGFILVFSGDPASQTLGGGFLGTILGYWIK